MSYQVLARKWRPRTFQELTGQEHVAKTLENAIKASRIAQAYLFSGARGVGKTTVARILAKSLNCIDGPTPTPCMKCQSCTEIAGGFSVDVIEIDGASHTGVDNVRELQESAQYAPLRGRYKVYIIDEVHMLSTSAFNALLKILEEPPPHIVFIFATTEPHKIPNTIQSRCQHFQFRRISYKEIMDRLVYILQEEGLKASEDAISFVARASDGSMRDALSLLDQVIAYTGGDLSGGDVSWILGLADNLIGPFMQHIIDKDSAKALGLLKDIVDGGYDLKQFCSNVVEHIRNLTMVKLGMGQDVIDLPAERIEEMVRVVERTNLEDIQRVFVIFSKALEEIRWFPYPRFSFEMAIIKAANMMPVVPVDEMLDRLAYLEKRLSAGVNTGEANMSLRDTKKHEKNVIPAQAGIQNADRGLDSHLRGNDGHLGAFSSEKAPTSKSANEKVSDLISSWRIAVEKIHESKPSLGSYLEQGVPVKCEDGILFIGFNGGSSVFINLIERQESKEFILNVVRNYMPEIAGIRFTTVQAKEGHSPAYDEYLAATHEKKRHEIEEVFSEPIIQEAIDILGGELVELRNRKGE